MTSAFGEGAVSHEGKPKHVYHVVPGTDPFRGLIP